MSRKRGRRAGLWGRWALGAILGFGLALAVALSFVSGALVAKELAPLPPRTLGIVGLAASGLVVVQLWLQLLAISRAARAQASASLSASGLAGCKEQMWLLDRLCGLLASENRHRRIAGRALDFFVHELGASHAVYWKPEASGEPAEPALARCPCGHAEAGSTLSATERAILARNAARQGAPVMVTAGGEPTTFDPAAPPQGPFALFLPMTASGQPQGVLEIEANGSSWSRDRWEMVESLVNHVALALERGRRFEEMRQRADEDFTTGLYNGRFVHSYLHRLLAMAGRRGRKVAILLLDVDNFKSINDSLGHGTGDRVLQSVADQLRLMAEGVGIVGRSGGDEFMVVLPDAGRAEAESFAQAVQDWLSQGTAVVKGLFRLRVSCGFAVYPDDAQDRQELLAVADTRLYEAKGRGRSAVFAHAGNGQGQRSLGVFGLLDQLVDTIHSRDHYTRVHCERTAEYAVLLAQRLGLSPSVQRTLRLAGLLHDVGKIAVPERILRKPGPLSDGETEILRHQQELASYLIADIPNALEVRRVVRHSRERWDGTGYPDGLQGEEIPYLSRILAVADTFAAITMDRPYRSGVPPVDACRELMAAAGSQLDPELVRTFVAAIDPGTPAEPGSGTLAPFDQAAAS